MCHNPAILYRMTNRGFIREGYFADLTLVDLNSQWTVAKKPLVQMWLVTIEGTTFYQSNADFVNGKQFMITENSMKTLDVWQLTIKKSKCLLFQKTLHKQSNLN
jgi:dihydroorotase-like cyclic amidohydrolase